MKPSFFFSPSSSVYETNNTTRRLDGYTGVNKLGPVLADTHLTQLVSHLDRLVQILALGQGTQEATGKHVTCTVRIDDLVVGEFGDGVRLGVGVGGFDVACRGGGGGGGDEGGVGALGDDDETGAGGVGFGERGEGGGDLGQGCVLRLSARKSKRWGKTYGHAGGGGVGGGLALVTNQDIDMGQELFELNLEELGDKGGRQVEDDDLALGGRILGNLEGTLDTVGEEIALDVKVGRAVDNAGDVRVGEMGRREFLGGTEGGAEGTVVVGENDGTGARLGGGRLDLVGGEDALGLVGLLQCVPEVVVADGADVGDRVGGEDVLWRQ